MTRPGQWLRAGRAGGVAAALGALARVKPITIYAAGPRNDYGEHFLAQVTGGALTLEGQHGEFGEALVLRSARAA